MADTDLMPGRPGPRPDVRVPRRRDTRACCPTCAAGGVCERRDFLNDDHAFARSQDV